MDKLNMHHKHILKLIDRDSDETGWTTVSETLYPHVSTTIPAELAEFEKLEKGGRARLTEEGQNVVRAMNWL